MVDVERFRILLSQGCAGTPARFPALRQDTFPYGEGAGEARFQARLRTSCRIRRAGGKG